MESDDIVTISDDSDVEYVQSVVKTSEYNEDEDISYMPPDNENIASDILEIPKDLENLSQEELDKYLNTVKEQINNYNKDCEDSDQIIVDNEVQVEELKKKDDGNFKQNNDIAQDDDDDDDDDDDNIVVIIGSPDSRDFNKTRDLQRKIIPEPAKRKLRKKSDPKTTHLRNRLTPRIPSKPSIPPKMVDDKPIPSLLPSNFARVVNSTPKMADPYVEEELAAHSGLDDYLFKPKRKSVINKSTVKKKPKAPVEKSIKEEKVEAKIQEIENIPSSVTGSLRKILQTTANTPEEKFRVLDARDKLYKIMRDRDPAEKRGALLGTCPDMCPEKERLMREYQFQVSIFEMTNYPKNTALDHNLAVKQYSRSSADQEEPLPHELRPVSVLTMTMNYLLHNIVDHCELSDDNLEEWYQFMWDRTRALRKELTQQGIHNVETVTLVEQCARFHIHCAERLVDQDSAIYDDKINTENLTKCLQTLKYMYKDLANLDIFCQNEPEFVCYSLLLNLNNTSVFTELSDMSEQVMMSSPVRFALDIMAAWETRNYIRFFNLVKRTTYLNCCLLRRYFNEMRLHAIKTMIRSYCTKNYSPQMAITHFVENLNFEREEECQRFLAHCNFQVYNLEGVATVNFDRMAFQNPESLFPPSRAFIFIESKKEKPLSVVMAGGFLPPKCYENHVLQTSFSPSGELMLDPALYRDLLDSASMPPPPPLVTKIPEFKRDSGKASGPVGIHTKSVNAPKVSSRDPRLRPNADSEKIPTFPSVEDKEKTSSVVFNNSNAYSIFGPKAETNSSGQPNPFAQKQDSTFGPKSGTNWFNKKPEPKPETNSFAPSSTSGVTPIFGPNAKLNMMANVDHSLTQGPIFSKTPKTMENSSFAQKPHVFSKNIFSDSEKGGQLDQKPMFSFDKVDGRSQHIFGKTEPNKFSAFGKPSVFDNEAPKPVSTTSSNDFSKFSFSEALAVKKDDKPPSFPSTQNFSQFRFQPPVDYEEEKRKKELAEKEKLEREMRERREEEDKRRREEEERKRKEEEMRKKLEMERRRKLEEEQREREKRERERREEEERLRKIEMERREREERLRREEFERQQRIKEEERKRLEEIRKAEALKREIETAQRLKVEAKMKDLREKFQNWKMKIWFEKWRMKTWNLIEGKKMKSYSEELKLKYPPVCSEEALNGNPYGLVIPSVLVLQSYQNRRRQRKKKEESPRKMLINDLPVLKVPKLVAKILENSVKKLYEKEYSPFPWKLVLSVPDESEAADSWKYIETFVEMHFVDNFNWQFGKQAGPLYYGEYGYNAFRFNVSIRRVRGVDLCEGEKTNLDALVGSNGLIFLMTDEEGSIRAASKRLSKVLLSRHPLPQIPVVIFILGNKIDNRVKEELHLDHWCKTHISEYCVIVSHGKTQEELATKLIESVKTLAEKTSPVSPFRSSTLSHFFSNSDFFSSVWRRIETSLSNFKIILRDPKYLIEYYNACIDRLGELFLDESHEDYTLLGDEFRSDFKLCGNGKRPVFDESYTTTLLSHLEFLKLPHWPKEIPKSCHQLNYRIHQYCKKIAEQEKPTVKNVKWVLYRIIRRSLLWKGLDIYCDEDINDILENFPWVQVFQELSRALLRRFLDKLNQNNDLTIVYDVNKIEKLSFESSLIGKFLNKNKGKSNIPKFETSEESNPHLENDSIIYAYSYAVEKESSKRKRESSENEHLDFIFGSPANKVQIVEENNRPTVSNEYSDLKTDFETISDKLEEIKRRMEENRKMIIETQTLLQ